MASGCRITKASAKKARKAHSCMVRMVRIVHDSRFVVMPWKTPSFVTWEPWHPTKRLDLSQAVADHQTGCPTCGLVWNRNWEIRFSFSTWDHVEVSRFSWHQVLHGSARCREVAQVSFNFHGSDLCCIMHVVTNDAVKASIFLLFQELSEVWTNLKSISFSIIQSLLDNFHQEGFHLVSHGEFQLFHSRIKLIRLDLHRLNAKLYRPTSAPQETCQVEHFRRSWCSIWSLLL